VKTDARRPAARSTDESAVDQVSVGAAESERARGRCTGALLRTLGHHARPSHVEEPRFGVRLEVGEGDHKYCLDTGRLLSFLSRVGAGSATRTSPVHLAPRMATASEVAQLKRMVESGQVCFAQNVKAWFRCECPTITAEQLADEVAGLAERTLGRPEQLIPLVEEFARRELTAARLCGGFVTLLRKVGVDINLPGGAPQDIASLRALVLDMADAFEEALPILFGGIRSSAAMGPEDMPDVDEVLRDAVAAFREPRSFAAQAGLTLTDAQAAELKLVLDKDAFDLVAAYDEHFELRKVKQDADSFPTFMHALLADSLAGSEKTTALRAAVASGNKADQ